jgi:hypothetical protein
MRGVYLGVEAYEKRSKKNGIGPLIRGLIYINPSSRAFNNDHFTHGHSLTLSTVR